jgi:acetyl esterase/lipase
MLLSGCVPPKPPLYSSPWRTLSTKVETTAPTDSLLQVAAHAKDINVDPSKGFIVGGTSAGGNLSAVMGLLARDHELSPPLTGLYLCIPAVLSDDVVPEKYAPLYLSYEQNRDAPILPVSAIKLFMGI